jgi:hypothetical protein
MKVLQGMFPECLISSFGNIPQPAKSPDLTATDFSLWGHLNLRCMLLAYTLSKNLKDCFTKGTGRTDGVLLESRTVSERNYTSD